MRHIIASSLLYSSAIFATHCIPSGTKPPVYNKTMDTIGDSITWSGDGNKFRCILLDKGFKYDFVGAFMDSYGYAHDGQGGNTTIDLLARLDTIPKADRYFVLIGVNDLQLMPQQTVNNIFQIVNRLQQKNRLGVIYISTLLPSTSQYNNRNNEVNNLLRLQFKCENCNLIDTGAYFSSLPNWEHYLPDGLHPNQEGYELISDYLVKKLL